MRPAIIIGSIALGIISGLITVYILPAALEIFLWILLSVIAAAMAQRNGMPTFRSGFLIALTVSVAVTFTHMLLLDDYISNHRDEIREIGKIKIADSYALTLLAMAPIYWVLFGLATGFVSMLGRKLRRRLLKRGV